MTILEKNLVEMQLKQIQNKFLEKKIVLSLFNWLSLKQLKDTTLLRQTRLRCEVDLIHKTTLKTSFENVIEFICLSVQLPHDRM